MKYYFDREGYLWCEDLTNREIISRNFSGINARSSTKYPGPDNKQFAVVIRDNDFAQEMIDQGWPVYLRVPKVDYDPQAESYYVMYVSVRFKDRYGKFFTDNRKPSFFLYSDGVMTEVGIEACTALPNDELMQSEIDKARFQNVRLRLRKGKKANGDPQVFLSRFDGMLYVNEADRAPEGWVKQGE